jgi:hypothetical protein
MQLYLRFLAVLTGWLTASAFSVGVLSVVYAETVKTQPIKISSDQRYEKYLDGTILDKKNSLMWMSSDYWQMEHKWVNWYTAKEYVQRMNNKKFAGYNDWRLPSVKEASLLYERRKRNTDKDGDKIFIDNIFPKGAGWSTWTSEDKQNKALVVSFKDEGGKSFQDKVTATDAFLRLVRHPTPQ